MILLLNYAKQALQINDRACFMFDTIEKSIPHGMLYSGAT